MKYSIILLFFIACSTPEKAKKNIDKINKKYPEVLVNFCRDTFPCVTMNIDTLIKYDTNYTIIRCNDYDPIDTFFIDTGKIKTITKSVYIASKSQTKYITKIIKDSAELISCELELLGLNKKNNQLVIDNNKLEKKISRRTFWLLYLIIAFLFSVILNIIKFK